MAFINTALLRAMAAVAGWRNERGQDLIEYALLGGFIAVAFAAAAIALPLSGFFDDMVGAIAECVNFDTVCP